MKCNYDESHRLGQKYRTEVWVSSGGNDHLRGKVMSSADTPR